MKLLISMTNYKLKVIKYLGDFYFTCHWITSDYDMWFHDGRITERTCYEKVFLSEFNNIRFINVMGKKQCL